MFFYSRAGADVSAFVGQMTCRLHGMVDVPAFGRAWNDLIARHPALRTAFTEQLSGVPRQEVLGAAPLAVSEVDLRDRDRDDQASYVSAFVRRDRELGFDLVRPPLMRVTLLRLAVDETQLVWTRHHITMDGWSAAGLLGELSLLYESDVYGVGGSLPPPPPFFDYVDWLAEQDVESARHYWRRKLAGFTAPTPLLPNASLDRTEMPRDALLEEAGVLGADLSRAVRAFAIDHQLTQSTVLTGAWAILLARYSRSDDVLFGLTTSGRPPAVPGIETAIGLFLNTLPIRVRVPPAAGVVPFLRDLQQDLAESVAHGHLPLVDVRALADVPADRALFGHILVLESYPLDSPAAEGMTIGGLEVTDYQFIDQTNYPLNVGVVPGEESEFLAVYDPSFVDRGFIHRLMDNFRTTVASLVAPATTSVGTVEVVSAAERRVLLEARNRTDVDWGPAETLLDIATLPGSERDDRPAVTFGAFAMSHWELHEAANALARRLATMGVGPETVVALCLDSSPERVVAILATIKAGAAYLPLDDDQPDDRLAFMVADSRTPVVLTTADRLPRFAAMGVRVLEVGPSTLAERAAPFAGTGPTSQTAAYVLYTSGSTGEPKAVINTHGPLLNRVLWMQEAYPIGPGDRVLQKTPYTFDVSVWEFVWPLVTGATLVPAEPGRHRDPEYIRDAIQANGITVVHFVPSMLRAFLEVDRIEDCTTLRHVVCSGEALTPDLVDAFSRRVAAPLHNLYGPTEAAIDVTARALVHGAPGGLVSIGRPIANARMYVLDDQCSLMPEGCPGELYIGGTPPARGYLHRPGLTAAHFLPDPYARTPGARMYRTGDLGRYDPDGQLVHLGRTDFQVKIRGQRVELGEIESALSSCSSIGDVVVLAEELGPSDLRIVAHVVPGAADAGPGSASLTDTVREHARRRLPGHMVPSAVRVHAAFPMLANGKVDRGALRGAPGATVPDDPALVGPRTPVEQELADIWRSVLNIRVVGIRQSFFELGGHSLLLTRVGARISQAFGVDLPLRVLFNAPTIEKTVEALLHALLAEGEAGIQEPDDDHRRET